MRASAILGIWKAAGVYVPLDTELPEDRINMIVTKTKMKVILYQTKDCRQLISSVSSSVTKINLETLAVHAEISVGCVDVPPPGALQSLLSYNLIMCVFTTSGSTGEPKYVPIRKINVLNRLWWYWEEFPFEIDEVGCQKTKPIFIDHLFEIFAFLLKGVPVAIIPRCHVRDPRTFFLSLIRYRVSRIVLVPTLLNNMLSTIEPGEGSKTSLRMVFSEGEALSPNLAQQFLGTFPNIYLINGYGCTETAADVTFDVYKGLEDCASNQSEGYMSIGRPLANTHVYLLDNMLRPVKEGEVGCIYAAGRNVVDGYLDPAGGSFVSNKFHSGTDYRVLYKTGDYATMKKSRLIFQGRDCDTIKIRGQRVNLREVECSIQSCPSVKSVVVLPYHVTQGVVNIVAFYSCSQHLQQAEIRMHYQRTLPRYMWPILVSVKEIPTQSWSGKVDRVKLIHVYKHLLAQTSVGDMDLITMDTPAKLRHIVAATIGIPTSEFDMDENFFDIGGNSLSALMVIHRMQETGIRLSVQEFFQAKALKELFEKPLSGPHFTDVMCLRYEVIKFKQYPRKEDLILLLARSFSEKNPLHNLVGTKESQTADVVQVIRKIWTEICEDNLSVVVIDRQSKFALAATLGSDIKTPTKLSFHYHEITRIVEAVQKTVIDDMLKSGKSWLKMQFAGCDPALPDNISMLLIEMMEQQLFGLALERGFDGIVTTNTNPAIAVSLKPVSMQRAPEDVSRHFTPISCIFSKPTALCIELSSPFKFDRGLVTIVAEAPDKLLSDTMIFITNLAIQDRTRSHHKASHQISKQLSGSGTSAVNCTFKAICAQIFRWCQMTICCAFDVNYFPYHQVPFDTYMSH